jgi:hypothetical protein
MQAPHEEVAAPVVAAPVVEPVVEVAVVVEPAVETPVVPVAPAPAADPAWNAGMKKAELLKIAQDLGLAVSESDTKAAILTALDGTLAGQ